MNITIQEFIELDWDYWGSKYQENDYLADLEFQDKYNKILRAPDLEFVCSCISPTSASFLHKVLDNMVEIEADEQTITSLRIKGWSELGITGYSSSIHKSTVDGREYLVYINSAIEYIYSINQLFS